MESDDNNNDNVDKTVDFSFLGSINNSRYDKLKTLITIYGKKKDKLRHFSCRQINRIGSIYFCKQKKQHCKNGFFFRT
jgi:homoaconitase/3-isopropylmalate dehydratase large subunit